MPEFLASGPRQVFVLESVAEEAREVLEGTPGAGDPVGTSPAAGRAIARSVAAPGVLDLADPRFEGGFEGRAGPPGSSSSASRSQASGPRSVSSRSKIVPPRMTASRREGGNEGRALSRRRRITAAR